MIRILVETSIIVHFITKLKNMRKVTWAASLLVTCTYCVGQDYVDILKSSYGNTRSGFKGSDQNATLHSVDVSLSLPLKLDESTFFLTGADFNSRSMSLYPKAEATILYNTIFRLGISRNFNEKWNAYIVALPRFASDYKSNFGSSFLIGGFAMAKFKKRENLTYKFGLYGSQEAYGFFGTPLLGFFYRGSGRKFAIDATLPLFADVNYGITKKSSIGIDYNAARRSMYLGKADASQLYVENNEIGFAPYFQFRTLDSKLLLKAKAGYSTVELGVYSTNDERMIGISAFDFGKNRTMLNPETKGGLLLKLEIIYRMSTNTGKN